MQVTIRSATATPGFSLTRHEREQAVERVKALWQRTFGTRLSVRALNLAGVSRLATLRAAKIYGECA